MAKIKIIIDSVAETVVFKSKKYEKQIDNMLNNIMFTYTVEESKLILAKLLAKNIHFELQEGLNILEYRKEDFALFYIENKRKDLFEMIKEL